MSYTNQREQFNPVSISVLMSVYNGAKTLAKAIDSILVQTYEDFEFIICDDGSSDATWQILQQYSKKDQRVICFQNTENIGLGASLNRCLARARGTYIARQDADDYSEPNRLEKTLRYLESNHLPFAACGVYIVDDAGVWSRRCFPEHINKHIIAQRNPFFHPTMIFLREILASVNGYSETKITCRTEDYDLVMRLAANNIIGQNLQEYLYYVYEPPAAYLRHTAKTRINEVRVRFAGLQCMHAPITDYFYLIKPIIMALMPRPVIRIIKKAQWDREGK